MQNFKSIDPVLAHECFDYRPETGELVWKVREGRTMASRNTRWAGTVAGHVHTCTVGKRYVQVRVNNIIHYAHRVAWVLMNGAIPAGMQVDHIDGDGTNNRADNLRLVTASGNKRNLRKMKTNTTGYTGVYAERGTFAARAWVNGKFLYLGRADTAEEAYAIRQRFNADNGFHQNHGLERAL